MLRAQLRTDAGDRETYLNIAQVYERGRRYKEAEEAARAAEVLPGQARENEMVWFLLGAIYERQKFFDKAEQQFKKVLAVNPKNAPVLNYYGYMLGDLGIRLDEAETLVQQALKEDPYNGAYLDSLGWIYFKENKLGASESTLRKAVERERHDATIHSHLGDLYAKLGRGDLAAAEWEKSLVEWRRSLPADMEADKVAELEKKLSQSHDERREAVIQRMPEVRIPALAKINLRLDILGKRTDGFHELRTIFQTISLHDELRLRASRRPGIALSIDGDQPLSAEPAEKNLVYRAVDVLRQELKIRGGVEIELKKTIPAGRGLGGGSSDAAAALLGYLRLTKKKLAAARLLEIASSLGADVPFFLFGGRALGVNKGDEIYPLPDIPKLHVLVVSPKEIHVPTPDAYRWLEAKPFALTKSAVNSKLFEFCALSWSAQGSGLSNDFEGPVFRRHPRLDQIKQELLQRGAAEASLAGSGSAVFGVFPPHDQTFVCETVSRERYARLMRTAE